MTSNTRDDFKADALIIQNWLVRIIKAMFNHYYGQYSIVDQRNIIAQVLYIILYNIEINISLIVFRIIL